MIDSGIKRRAALFIITSHQADVIQRISRQRTTGHYYVTLQLGIRLRLLQVNNIYLLFNHPSLATATIPLQQLPRKYAKHLFFALVFKRLTLL